MLSYTSRGYHFGKHLTPRSATLKFLIIPLLMIIIIIAVYILLFYFIYYRVSLNLHIARHITILSIFYVIYILILATRNIYNVQVHIGIAKPNEYFINKKKGKKRCQVPNYRLNFFFALCEHFIRFFLFHKKKKTTFSDNRKSFCPLYSL